MATPGMIRFEMGYMRRKYDVMASISAQGTSWSVPFQV